jgi:hypothetical protein
MFVNIAANDFVIIWNDIATNLIPKVMPVCISVVSIKVAVKWLKSELLGI